MNPVTELLAHAAGQLERIASNVPVACKVCAASTSLFDVVDFSKTCHLNLYPSGLVAVPVYYRRCDRCEFIFTDFFDEFTPAQWGTYVYNEEYRRIDPDYSDVRPAGNARVVDGLLRYRRAGVIGLDYGGGSGQTCERLRAMGYAYDTVDPFGESWLTPDFAGRYNFCSAFEVAEHTPDPVGFLSAIVNLADKGRLAILIGTQVHDKVVSASRRLEWWYAAPRNGHISLYSTQSLRVLAATFGLTYTGLSAQTHLFTREYTSREAYRFLVTGKLVSKLSSLMGMRK